MVLEIKRLLTRNASRLRARKFLESRLPELVPAALRGQRKRSRAPLVADRTADLMKLIDKVREELRAIAVSLK
jgi:hypothetical protein